ncbi:MAG: hypothetical protein QXP34_03045 [Candidatus Aenigmatarchaeota archaeon]
MQIKREKRNIIRIISFTLILTLIFYFIGIYVGFKIFEFFYTKELIEKINYLYFQTKSLNEEINSYKEIIFLDFLDKKTKCKLLENIINKVRDYSFNVIAKSLPYRVEEYEFESKLSDEYLKLKSEYMKMMSTSYFLTIKYKKECDTNISTLLYFYSSFCGADCINQGEELDKLREYNIDSYFFIIDKDWNLNEIKILNELFEINSVPSIVINEKYVLRGFSNVSTILSYFKKG